MESDIISQSKLKLVLPSSLAVPLLARCRRRERVWAHWALHQNRQVDADVDVDGRAQDRTGLKAKAKAGGRGKVMERISDERRGEERRTKKGVNKRWA